MKRNDWLLGFQPPWPDTFCWRWLLAWLVRQKSVLRNHLLRSPIKFQQISSNSCCRLRNLCDLLGRQPALRHKRGRCSCHCIISTVVLRDPGSTLSCKSSLQLMSSVPPSPPTPRRMVKVVAPGPNAEAPSPTNNRSFSQMYLGWLQCSEVSTHHQHHVGIVPSCGTVLFLFLRPQGGRGGGPELPPGVGPEARDLPEVRRPVGGRRRPAWSLHHRP